ncbi:translation initiation factor IF-2-like [Mustela putorius furo]|uniref:Translation initiation factor IF-2-like n=1 Tax=Mustela putorius furo TaxID=9669 RepID=A0A8U0R7Y4_MUSPF|nr:translation initiation factor IF-2-like [Mustela putorius furo]
MRKGSFLDAPEGPQSSLAQLDTGVHLPCAAGSAWRLQGADQEPETPLRPFRSWSNPPRTRRGCRVTALAGRRPRTRPAGAQVPDLAGPGRYPGKPRTRPRGRPTVPPAAGRGAQQGREDGWAEDSSPDPSFTNDGLHLREANTRDTNRDPQPLPGRRFRGFGPAPRRHWSGRKGAGPDGGARSLQAAEAGRAAQTAGPTEEAPAGPRRPQGQRELARRPYLGSGLGSSRPTAQRPQIGRQSPVPGPRRSAYREAAEASSTPPRAQQVRRGRRSEVAPRPPATPTGGADPEPRPPLAVGAAAERMRTR